MHVQLNTTYAAVLTSGAITPYGAKYSLQPEKIQKPKTVNVPREMKYDLTIAQMWQHDWSNVSTEGIFFVIIAV